MSFQKSYLRISVPTSQTSCEFLLIWISVVSCKHFIAFWKITYFANHSNIDSNIGSNIFSNIQQNIYSIFKSFFNSFEFLKFDFFK